MYQKRVRHVLSPIVPRLADEDSETLWGLFSAVGDHWRLGDGEVRYRLRFDAFTRNRINLNPLYVGYYQAGSEYLRQRIDDLGSDEAYRSVFEDRVQQPLAVPVDADALASLRKYVVDEFIALRLALGGFRAFGAINHRGYFGGANIEGRAAPYRTDEASA